MCLLKCSWSDSEAKLMHSCSKEFSFRFSNPNMSSNEILVASCKPPRCIIELIRWTNLQKLLRWTNFLIFEYLKNDDVRVFGAFQVLLFSKYANKNIRLFEFQVKKKYKIIKNAIYLDILPIGGFHFVLKNHVFLIRSFLKVLILVFFVILISNKCNYLLYRVDGRSLLVCWELYKSSS